MALKTYSPEQIIYEKGSAVNEISILIKGQVKMLIGSVHITMDAGSVIGLEPNPQNIHQFTYKASTDCAIYSYEYSSLDDLLELFQENVKLAPTITMHMVSHCCNLYELTEDIHQKADSLFEQVHSDLEKYPDLCAKTGTKVEDFHYITVLDPPSKPIDVPNWQVDFFNTLNQHTKTLTPVYSLGPDACVGFLVHCFSFLRLLMADLENTLLSLDEYKRHTSQFRMTIDNLRREQHAIGSGTKEMEMPSMENILSYILAYADIDGDMSDSVTQAIDSYVAISDRSDTSDTLRGLRRKISTHFYDIYKKVLLKSIEDEGHSPIIDLFLMFGVMDERLVDQEDIEKLYGFYCTYNPAPDTRIITMADWLKKVYCLECEPSLNEFQQDYTTYLREAKQNGDITAEQLEAMKEDPISRLNYEIKNAFTLTNRMAYGRVSTFVPIFDSQNNIVPLERSHLSVDILMDELARMDKCDVHIFHREQLFKYPGNDNIQLYIHEKQTPYLILLPLVGQRMILWQNIEGRRRNTPARMMLPMFFEENISDSFTSLCAEYRWEICKTDQGVRWTDITDPSLTAEYHDYLQFFKKNSAISPDNKEKIKLQVKKYQNNFKKVFISDYLNYIKYEVNGNMRLNKHAREIIFKYCSFNAENCEKLASTPAYQKLLEIKKNKLEQKLRPLSNLVQKAEHSNEVVPEEILAEIEYFKS